MLQQRGTATTCFQDSIISKVNKIFVICLVQTVRNIPNFIDLKLGCQTSIRLEAFAKVSFQIETPSYKDRSHKPLNTI